MNVDTTLFSSGTIAEVSTCGVEVSIGGSCIRVCVHLSSNRNGHAHGHGLCCFKLHKSYMFINYNIYYYNTQDLRTPLPGDNIYVPIYVFQVVHPDHIVLFVVFVP